MLTSLFSARLLCTLGELLRAGGALEPRSVARTFPSQLSCPVFSKGISTGGQNGLGSCELCFQTRLWGASLVGSRGFPQFNPSSALDHMPPPLPPQRPEPALFVSSKAVSIYSRHCNLAVYKVSITAQDEKLIRGSSAACLLLRPMVAKVWARSSRHPWGYLQNQTMPSPEQFSDNHSPHSFHPSITCKIRMNLAGCPT